MGVLVELLRGYYEEFVAAYRDYLAGRERIYAVERLARVARDPCIDDVRDGLVRAAKRVDARYVLLFGSLARRGCGSDVDVAVKLGRRPRSMIDVGWIQAVFEDEVGAHVDLVILDIDVPPHLAKTLVDEAVVVYGDRNEALEDLARLYSMYLDYVVFKEKLRRFAA